MRDLNYSKFGHSNRLENVKIFVKIYLGETGQFKCHNLFSVRDHSHSLIEQKQNQNLVLSLGNIQMIRNKSRNSGIRKSPLHPVLHSALVTVIKN